MQDWLREEKLALDSGYRTVAGIDEAGRGALAGPVVAACVVLPNGIELPGVDDSKKLSASKREELFETIMTHATGVGVGIVEAGVIDEINILKATHRAMRLSLANLPPSIQPDLALIDGLPVRPFPIPQNALVRGDGRSVTIAAASIIAKVTRDRLMLAFDQEFPEYGFASHKGYGAKRHLKALETLGPCAIHRLTFRPINPAPKPVKKTSASRANSNIASDLTPDLFAESTPLPDLPSTSSETLSSLPRSLTPTSPHLASPAKRASSPSSTKRLGNAGEEIAALYLQSRGWRIIARNYRCKAGEMDIVAEAPTLPDATLVFAEVKTRRGKRHGSALEAVNARKQAKLISIALSWLGEASRGGEEPLMRFDVIEVYQEPNGLSQVTLHQGAFTG